MTTLLPTTTAGSLPKPCWLAEPETLWSPWKLAGDELVAGKRDALRLAVDDQRQAGIDILGDGEQTRQHFVTTFVEHLAGVDFQKRETVRIRNRYDASVPTITGAVSRPTPVFVDDARFLRAQTDRPIKWTLPGPMTMIDTLYDAHYRSRARLAWEFACILNEEAQELVAAGVDGEVLSVDFQPRLFQAVAGELGSKRNKKVGHRNSAELAALKREFDFPLRCRSQRTGGLEGKRDAFLYSAADL